MRTALNSHVLVETQTCPAGWGCSTEPAGSPAFLGILEVERMLARTAVIWSWPERENTWLHLSSRLGQDGLALENPFDEGGGRTSRLFL